MQHVLAVANKLGLFCLCRCSRYATSRLWNPERSEILFHEIKETVINLHSSVGSGYYCAPISEKNEEYREATCVSRAYNHFCV
jgi:hypothetical protein